MCDIDYKEGGCNNRCDFKKIFHEQLLKEFDAQLSVYH